MPKKKKFIDKKNSITFHLVHRSQKDPLTADERAPKHVLVPLDQKHKEDGKSDTKDKKEEQRKYGIFFDDDYNYLQHLRDANEISVEWEPVERFRINKDELPSSSSLNDVKQKITLPSSVFASNVEEDVGLLNKAAPHSGPRLDYDPDVIAAMDEDFDFDDPDNQLDDDFVALANASNSSEEDDEGSEDVGSEDGFGNASWDEELDEVGSLNDPFAGLETKSHFTEYSMSSSVIRRNEQLTLLDSRFEKMFESYDDNEIGALECEEIEGDMPMDSKLLTQFADEFEQEQAKIALEEARKEAHGDDDDPIEEDSEEEKEETIEIGITSKDDSRWDCESILSTYSNIYNHPKLIQDGFGNKNAIKVSGKTGVPLGVLRDARHSGLTSKGLAALEKSFAAERGDEDEVASVATSAISQLSLRPKGETPEERKQRKQALKEYRKERRLERKANTLAFKDEKKRQEKVILNNKKNIYNVKIV